MSVRHKPPRAKARRETGTFPRKTDAEVKAILTQTMAGSSATPAAVYAFLKNWRTPMESNEHRLLPNQFRAWNDAIEEYQALAKRSAIVV